ncbi:DUF3727 domain-containing protein [Vulcanococcus limneticus]|uniref:DUF3727 domain-containing protein n=1 Tax=Vulcanococcus limneticus TaxID=2170428 RepID=UPI00398C1DD2
MSSDSPSTSGSGDVPTVLVRDGQGRRLLCFLEQLIPLDGHDYGLMTPVDTPVCLVRLAQDDDEQDEPIDELEGAEEILSIADVILQEEDLTLIRSAVTLTVSGELEEPDPDEIDPEAFEDDETEEEESDLYEMLGRPFWVGEEQYALFVPIDPFFVVARIENGEGVVVEGEEFERIQPRIEAELDERELAGD